MSTDVQPVHDRIVPAQPRETVQVQLDDGRLYEGPVGTPLVEFMDVAMNDHESIVTAALVDGQFRELGFPVMRDCDVTPVDTYSSDGLRIYQRAITFVLIVAARELFPEARLLIDHSVTLGAFFCQVVGRPEFTEVEMEALSQRMHEIISADEPIYKERLPLKEAIEMFASQGYDDKVRLFTGREDGEVTVYTLRGVCDYFYGHMLPRTGRLERFSLEHYLPGFILRSHVPRHAYPLESHGHYPKLMEVFREYGRWLRILGIEDVGSMNAAIEQGEAQRAVLVSEALHEKRISEIAAAILAGVIGTITAFGFVRSELPYRETLATFLLLPLMISPVITGVAILRYSSAVGFPRGYPSIILAHSVLALPYVFLIVRSQLLTFDERLEDASRLMGANQLETVFNVTLPNIAPGIAAGMLLAFIISFGEFTATQFLVTPGTTTIPVIIFTMISTGMTPEISALATVLVVLLVIIGAVSEIIS